MGPSRRNVNGRSPLVNQQRQITSFFTKSTSPILSNPNPNPSSSPVTPSQPRKPLILIGASPSPPSTDVVGRRVKVYWPLDKAWYEGSVKSFNRITSKHLVRYDDGEEEALDLSKEKIEWLPRRGNRHSQGEKKLKRLRKMVIEDDNVDEIHKHDDVDEIHKHDDADDELVDDDGGVIDDGDDSSDEDWGKNMVVEDEDDDDAECEEDMELEEEEEEKDVAKRKPSEKVEARKRKLGGNK